MNVIDFSIRYDFLTAECRHVLNYSVIGKQIFFFCIDDRPIIVYCQDYSKLL